MSMSIIVPLDGSPFAERGLTHCLEAGSAFGGSYWFDWNNHEDIHKNTGANPTGCSASLPAHHE